MSKIPYGIRSVKIENFRCIDTLELDFTDPQGNPSDIVVIGGPNGCGKTAVLEACYSLIQGNSPKIRESDKENVVKRLGNSSFRYGSNRYYLTIDVQTPTGIHNRDYEAVFPVPIGHLPISNVATNICSIYISSRRVQKLSGALSVSLGKATTLEEMLGLRTHKNDNRILTAKEEDRLVSIKQHLIDMRTFELMGGATGETYFGYNTLVTELDTMWNQFYPHLNQSFAAGPVGSDPHEGFDLFLTTTTATGGQRVAVDMLSAGQLELVSLFGTLSQLARVPSIIFIDEPELHLDPQWHATLLHELRRFLPQAQLIVATHSPRIMESVRSYQRFFLVPTDDPRMTSWGLKDKLSELAHA